MILPSKFIRAITLDIDKLILNLWRSTMSIFTHVTVGTNDLNKARAFYDNVLATLGYNRITDLGENGSI